MASLKSFSGNSTIYNRSIKSIISHHLPLVAEYASLVMFKSGNVRGSHFSVFRMSVHFLSGHSALENMPFVVDICEKFGVDAGQNRTPLMAPFLKSRTPLS